MIATLFVVGFILLLTQWWLIGIGLIAIAATKIYLGKKEIKQKAEDEHIVISDDGTSQTSKFLKIWFNKESGDLHFWISSSDTVRIEEPENISNIDLAVPLTAFRFAKYDKKELVESKKVFSGVTLGGRPTTLIGSEFNSMYSGRTSFTIYDGRVDYRAKLVFNMPFKMSIEVDKFLESLKDTGKLIAENNRKEKLKAAGITSQDKFQQQMKKWGYQYDDSVMSCWYFNIDNGDLRDLLVAFPDGQGGAVYNEGKDSWSGSWKGAIAEIDGKNLLIKVNDDEYRKKYFKERRFQISTFSAKDRNEWFDRIKILSA